MLITLRVDEETSALLKAEAQDAGGSVGELVAEMVADQLARAWGDEAQQH